MATDVGIQYLESKITGNDFKVDFTQAIISGASGAATGGISMASKATKLGKLGKALYAGVDVGKDTVASMASQYNENGEIDLATVVGDVVLGQAGGKSAGKSAEKILNQKLKVMEKQLDRMERINSKNSRASRRSAISQAKGDIALTESQIVAAEVFGDRSASGISDLAVAAGEKVGAMPANSQIIPVIQNEQ